MTKVSVSIHPSIRVKDLPGKFEGKYSNVSLKQAMSDLLGKYPEIYELCMRENGRKPGILYISEGAELGSLGMLDNIIGEEERIEVSIIPILHGG